jgi:xanthine dehydrogenase accessory factor
MTRLIAERMADLRRQRVPFVRATVVRAQAPTSTHPGDHAVILADGSIEGFVGGQCAEESVRVGALQALADGQALLLRILPGTDDAFPDTPGARVVANPCLSGGGLEIFLEPQLPAPLVCVVGSTPIADAVAALAGAVGFAADTGTDLQGCRVEQAVAVVVASHGHDEPASIRTALDAGVPFVGLVASRTRGAAVLDAMDLSDQQRAAVRTPVGLDIGARNAEEVALSILAEVVRAVRTEHLAAPASRAANIPVQSVDPVCGMTVVVGPETPHAVVAGNDVWFCCPGCRDRYAA